MSLTRTAIAFLTLAVVSIAMPVMPASAQDAEDATEIGISQLAVPNGEIVSISPDLSQGPSNFLKLQRV